MYAFVYVWQFIKLEGSLNGQSVVLCVAVIVWIRALYSKVLPLYIYEYGNILRCRNCLAKPHCHSAMAGS